MSRLSGPMNTKAIHHGLSISIDGGEVTLGGKLDNWYERDLAETAAWSVPGVTQVLDKISLTS